MKFQEKYKNEILPKLKEKFGYQNVHQIPRFDKVVLNVGFGRHAKEKAYVDIIDSSLTRISGQKPSPRAARKSISAFKLREGSIIGSAVTLRGARMYDFLEKLIAVTLPRVRDFRGLSAKGIDQKGNYTIGIKEHLAFPEIGLDEVDTIHGLEICIATTAKNREEGLELFRLAGFPFKTEEESKK